MAATPLDAFAKLQELATTRALDRFCEAHDVALLVAFGSVVDPERAGEARDLDVAVRFGPDGSGDLLAFTDALARLLDFGEVDVMDLARANVIGRYKALVATRPLYQDRPGRWANEQIAAMLEYMDTAWLRDLDRGLMAGME